jgi:hypothetical protein
MSKAEERALEYYPIIDRKDYPCKKLDAAYREVFLLGYHQAEKDLELTWEDIERIDAISIKLDGTVESKEMSGKEFYQEVLKRFKEMKEHPKNEEEKKETPY